MVRESLIGKVFILLLLLTVSLASAEAPPYVDALRSKDPESVASAVDRFRTDPDPAAVSQLMSLLSDPDPLLRREGARGLGVVNRPDVRRALQKLMRREREVEVRAQAALSLREMGVSSPARQLEEDLIARLTRPLESQPAEIQRAALVRALALLESRKSIPLLRKIVRNPDEETSVRLEAASALSTLKDRSLFGRLLTMLRSSRTSDRQVAIGGLGLLGDRRAVPFIMRKTSDPSVEIRRATAIALGQLGDTRAIPPLRRFLTSDGDPQVRWRSAYALGRLQDADSLPEIRSRLWVRGTTRDREWALRAWLASDDASVLPWLEEGIKEEILPLELRKKALQRLIAGGEGEREFLTELTATAESEEELKKLARAALAETVVQAPPQQDFPPDSTAVESAPSLSPIDLATLRGELATAPQEERRLLVLQELVRRRDPSLKAEIEILLKADDPLSRRVGFFGLKETADPGLATRLLVALSDPSPEVRVLAISLLGEMNFPEGNTELLKKVLDPDSGVRKELARVLAKRPLSEELLVLAQDPDPDVRISVFQILIGRSDPELLPILMRAAREEDPPLRALALTVLQGFQSPDLTQLFMEKLLDPDPSVRSAAVAGLGGTLRGAEVSRLYPMLDDPSQEVRGRVADVLSRSGEREAIPVLRDRISKEPEAAYLRSALAGLEGRLLFPSAYLREGENPKSPIGYLSAGSRLFLYRGPILPLLEYNADADSWIPLDEQALSLGLFPDPIPFRILGDELVFRGEGSEGKEDHYRFPEKVDAVYLDGAYLWWGGEGMFGRFDRFRKEFVFTRPRALQGAHVTAIAVAKDLAWIGWEREGPLPRWGLLRLDLRTNDETVYDRGSAGVLEGAIESVFPQGDRIWLLQPSGAVRLDPPTEQGIAYRFLDRGSRTLILRQHLAAMGPEGLSPAEGWEEEMASADPLRRMEATWRLGLLRDAEAVPVLMARLEEAPPPERGIAQWALEQIRSPLAVGPLVDLLMQADPDRRAFYLKMLGEVGESTPRFMVLGMIGHFLDDPQPEVVAEALAALGKIGDRRATPWISHFLASTNPQISEAAESSLNLLSEKYGRAAEEPIRIEGEVQGILDRLRGEKVDLPSLRSDLNSIDHRRLLSALYRLNAPGFSLAPDLGRDIVRFLGVEDREVRWGAILLLQKMGKEGITAVKPFLDHSRPEVRRDAVRALSRVANAGEKGGDSVPDLLIQRLRREPVPSLRGEILTGLLPFLKEERWGERIRTVLTGIFRFDPQPQLRRKALLLLVDAGMEPTWPDLMAGLKVHENSLRIQVMEEMIQEWGRTKRFAADAGTSPSLERLLEEILREDSGSVPQKEWALQLVQTAAMRSLAEPLASILPDQPLRLRLQIEEALGDIGGKEEIPALVQRAELGDSRERYTVLSVLKKLGYPLNEAEVEWLSALRSGAMPFHSWNLVFVWVILGFPGRDRQGR
jgi:HEAT repeat protein